MRKRFATVLVLALLFASVAGAARAPVPDPFQGSADSGCDVAIAGRRAGSTSALRAVRPGAPSPVGPTVTFACSGGAITNRVRVARRSPRAVVWARFHRKLAASDGRAAEPPLVL
jgi:hypothetical protein